MPEIDPAVPSSQWELSDEGRTRCVPLAEKITEYFPLTLVTSHERRAQETASAIAGVLGLPYHIIQGLHEHERGNEPYLGLQGIFQAKIKELFQNPDQLVYGSETAGQSLARFEAAIRGIIARHPDTNIAAVSHGTVLSLFVAKYNHITAYKFWRELVMPDMIVLSLPNFSIIPSEQ